MSAVPSGDAAGPAFDVRQAGLADEAMIVIDEQQQVVMVNPAAACMFGCTAADMLGAPLSRFIPQRYRDLHAQHVRDYAASPRPASLAHRRQPITGLRANGDEFQLEATLSRVDAAGPLGSGPLHMALLRDLGERSALMARLTAQMHTIIDMAPTAIWITEGDNIVFANQACAALFGAADYRQLLGRSIYSLLSPQSHATVRRGIERALAEAPATQRIQERVTRLDGTVRDIDIAVAALPDHGRTTLQMVISDVTDRVLAQRELQVSRRDLRRFAADLVEARESERRHIARELHDELAQRLTALKMAVATLDNAPQRSGPDAPINGMLAMIDDTAAAIRRIAADLRPPMLDDLGLNATIEWLVNGWAQRLGLKVSMRLASIDPGIGDAASTALYRILQEALTNIARHAQATAVQIQLRVAAESVVLSVQDNGIGLRRPVSHASGTLGLIGMRERCRMLGGHITIENAPRRGLRIVVRLPLVSAAMDADMSGVDPVVEVEPPGKRLVRKRAPRAPAVKA